MVGKALGIDLPPRDQLSMSLPRRNDHFILVHSGAGQAVRVWPLERYLKLVQRLRQENYHVHVACDPNQRDWWLAVGEPEVATPRTVKELMELLDIAAVFIGNDSGAGHLAAFNGLPTFTILGHNCQSGLRHCIRKQHGLTASLVPTNRAWITAASQRRTALTKSLKKKSGPA